MAILINCTIKQIINITQEVFIISNKQMVIPVLAWALVLYDDEDAQRMMIEPLIMGNKSLAIASMIYDDYKLGMVKGDEFVDYLGNEIKV